jgi:Zn finger protein HypA/HybF involved in hydrogenase expression
MLNQIKTYPLMNEDSIYPGSDVKLNFKPREVYCIKCKFRVITTYVNPQCMNCNQPLITVVKSHFEDLIDELA